MSIHIVDGFSPEARSLRSHFEERFSNPHSARADRFVWDYWHVPGQYTALRTPAYHFFPKKMYEAYHRRLVLWGRSTLGCHDVSPPWMSLYVEGCKQEWHGDVPHGPWAFVHSLTPWQKRRFSGGETLILKDRILDYWSKPVPRGLERAQIHDEIAPKFDRLTVFDPRYPHAVREVRGTHEPLEGRLVIHGWFVEPRPFIEGPLPEKSLQEEVDALTNYLTTNWPEGLALQGLLSIGFDVLRNGKVPRAKILSNQLRGASENAKEIRKLAKWLEWAATQFDFKKQSGASRVTLPFLFQ